MEPKIKLPCVPVIVASLSHVKFILSCGVPVAKRTSQFVIVVSPPTVKFSPVNVLSSLE